MEIKVYIDVLFFTNFIFDYLLLWLTGLLCRSSSATFPRLFSAACVGALYATLMFFLPVSFLYALPCKLLIGILMVALTFRPRRIRLLVQYACIFYTVSAFLGGAAFSFFYFSGSSGTFGAVFRNGSMYINIPTYQLLLLAIFCMPVVRFAFFCGKKMLQNAQKTTELSVEYEGKALRLHGFYDSGNRLQEAVSGKSVIIAQWNRAKHFFPDCRHPEDVKGLIPIPFHTLTEDGLLYAFLPDAIYILKKHTKIQTETVYIGLIDRTFDHHQNWDAILPHDFEGENHYETKPTSKTADFS